MRYMISEAIAKTIDLVVADAKAKHKILDVYQLASGVQQLHASDNVALEDIVERFVVVAGADCVIEFKTPLSAVMGSPMAANDEALPATNGHAVLKFG
jgi:hypothetical protein